MATRDPNKTVDITSDRVDSLLLPGRAVLPSDGKDSPVKAKMTFLAVILGTVVLALAMADGTPWP